MKNEKTNHQGRAGSMAIWCVAKDNVASTTMETHFNFWRIAGDKDFQGNPGHPPKDFLEIGLLIKNPTPIDYINIYLPIEIEKESIRDAGVQLSKTTVAQGIFNEKLQCLDRTDPARIELRNDTELFCRVHKFINNNGIIDASHLELVKFSEGTLIKIQQDAISSVSYEINADESIYFRLRVYLPIDKSSPFIHVITPHDHKFQSGFEEIEYIDFRFNEIRTLPELVKNKILQDERSGKVRISLVAFLTALPVHSDLSSCSAPSHKNRLLESDPWNNYVPSGIPGGMVVYHWKKQDKDGSGVADFSSFVKLRTRRSGKWILITYLIIAFMMGLLGNLVASGILWCFSSEPHASVYENSEAISPAKK